MSSIIYKGKQEVIGGGGEFDNSGVRFRISADTFPPSLVGNLWLDTLNQVSMVGGAVYTPTWRNGKPALYFGGITSNLYRSNIVSSSALNLNNDFCFFIVGQIESLPVWNWLFSIQPVNFVYSPAFVVAFLEGKMRCVYGNWFTDVYDGTYRFGGGINFPLTPFIICVARESGFIKTWINGVRDGTDIATSYSGFSMNTPYSVGCLSTDNNSFAKGYIAECIIANNSERARIEYYLNGKYAIY